MTGLRLHWYHFAAWLVAVALLLLLVVSPPVSATTPATICSAAGYGNSSYAISGGDITTGVCTPDASCTSAVDNPYWGYGNYTIFLRVPPDGCGHHCGNSPCYSYVTQYYYGAPTPTPTPEPKYCANYCGHRFEYPTSPGNLAIACYFNAGGCTVCENVLHLMSEAETYWPCKSSYVNVTVTQTPVPTYTYPTVTATPTATSTMLPHVTFTPVKIATIPTMADFKNTSGLDTDQLKKYIYSKLGMNLTSPYTDWCDSIANSVLSLIRAGFYIPDWPITTVTDMITSVNQILDTVITYLSSAVNVLLYFSTHAMNSLPDGIKWLMIYGCICDLAVLILRGET